MRKVGIVALGLLLSGCGFEPLYQVPDIKNPKENGLRNGAVPQINVYGEGYMAQHFRQFLETRCHLIPGLRNHRIDIRLNENKMEIGYSKQGVPLRTQLIYTANYKLYALPSENLIAQNEVKNSTSYEVNPDQEFINLSSQRGAQDRAIITLAEDVFRDLVQALKVSGHN